MLVLAACSLGGAGHLRPLLPLLDAARAAGHETLVVAPPALAALVAETAHPFAPGGEPPEAAIAPLREQLPRLPEADAARLAHEELFGRLATAAMRDPLDALVRDRRPGLILREPCEHASTLAGLRHGVALAQVAIGAADTEWAGLELAGPVVGALDRRAPAAMRAMPYLTALPAPLDPSPFPATVRFRRVPPAAVEPLPDWWDGSDAPLVYVTFGTVLGHMTIARDVLGAAVGAVAGLDARVLVTVGPAVDPDALGPLPGHVHVERWVDQDRVLAVADVVLCHGGSGTAYGALAAGVPVVCAPLFADQFDNARRIAAAGAGLAPTGEGRTPVGAADEPAIRAAVARALTDGELRERAAEVAAAVARTPTAGAALAHVLA